MTPVNTVRVGLISRFNNIEYKNKIKLKYNFSVTIKSIHEYFIIISMTLKNIDMTVLKSTTLALMLLGILIALINIVI